MRERKHTEYQQIKDAKPNELYIEENSLVKQMEMRGTWFALMIFASFILPIGILKGFFELITGSWQQSAKTLIYNSVVSVGLMLASMISLFFPSVVRNITTRYYTFAAYTTDITQQFKKDRLRRFVIDRIWVPTKRGTIDTAIIQLKMNPTNQFTLQFCANGYAYQEIEEDLFLECATLQRNIVAFNYPGNTKHDNDYLSHSVIDLINAGIAEVYYLANTNRWTNENIASNLQLYGHSIGGAVALQVAVYFKEKYHIDIPVHVDRSFSSISAILIERFNEMFYLPKWLGKIFAPLLLTAGGGWEFDSVAACKKLNPKMIHYYNLGRHNETNRDADPVIPDSATLATGLSNLSSSRIFKEINVKHHAHLIFGNNRTNHNDHAASKYELFDASGKHVYLDIYREQLNSHQPR